MKIPAGEQSGLLTRIAATESVSSRTPKESSLRFYKRPIHRQPAPSQSADGAGSPRCPTQRVGTASPHAEGDGSSGETSDGELYAFISVPAAFAGGMPLTHTRMPNAMPEA